MKKRNGVKPLKDTYSTISNLLHDSVAVKCFFGLLIKMYILYQLRHPPYFLHNQCPD